MGRIQQANAAAVSRYVYLSSTTFVTSSWDFGRGSASSSTRLLMDVGRMHTGGWYGLLVAAWRC